MLISNSNAISMNKQVLNSSYTTYLEQRLY